MMKATHFILTAGLIVAASAYVSAGPAYAAHEEDHESDRAQSHERERHERKSSEERKSAHHQASSHDRDDAELVPGVAHPVTLSNGGTQPLEVEIKFMGKDPRDFRQTNNCGETLKGQGSCVINVTFAPRAAGPRSATMEIQTSGGTKYVYLSGTGI